MPSRYLHPAKLLLPAIALLAGSAFPAKPSKGVTTIPEIAIIALSDAGMPKDSSSAGKDSSKVGETGGPAQAGKQRPAGRDLQSDSGKVGRAPADTAAAKTLRKISGPAPRILGISYYQQIDGRYVFDDSARIYPNALALRRVRPGIHGSSGDYSFQFMMDFSGAPEVLDAYGEIAFAPEARLRIGKTKTLFGLERLRDARHRSLIELGHPASLTPAYDLGVALHGDIRGGILSYSLGVYSGAIDGENARSDQDDEKDFAGRLFLHPFKYSKEESLRDFGLGFATGFGRKFGNASDPRLPVHYSEGHQVIFGYRSTGIKGLLPDSERGGAYASGRGYRVNPQGYWYVSSVGLLGEYVISSQQLMLEGGAGEASTGNFVNRAWNVTASFVATGETASFHGFMPRRPFSLWREDSFGGLELVLRHSRIDFDKNLFPVFADPAVSVLQATTWTGGLNWHLSGTTRLSSAYAWTSYKGGAPAGLNRSQERIFFGRVQMSF